MESADLARKSVEYRKTILTIIKGANAGHTGGSLSCIDILNVLYNRVMNVSPALVDSPDRDRYVHSKGHSVEALYTVLADKGFFGRAELDTLCKAGSHFVGHPTRKVPGIEQNTGALGHGLPVAVGMALAAKKDAASFRVFTIMGDGELAEGSVWEASMSASHYKLDNLVVIVDRNTLQITGRTEDVMRLDSLEARFAAFGYAVRHVDGNDVAALSDLFAEVPFEAGKPNLVLAHTVKGKGISFIEDKVKWHHHVPTDQEYASAISELELSEQQLSQKAQANHVATASR